MRRIGVLFLFAFVVLGLAFPAMAEDQELYYQQMQSYKKLNPKQGQRTSPSGQDDLYMDQMRSYKKLYADYEQKLKDKKNLQYEIANFQRVHDNMLKTMEKLQKKYGKLEEDYNVNVGLRKEWEIQLKSFEEESAQLNEEFWQKQQDYGLYQKKLAILKSQKDEAVRRMKKYEQRSLGQSRKMKRMDQEILDINDDAMKLKQQIRIKEKKLQFIDSPTRKR